jgi:hypothetical protein
MNQKIDWDVVITIVCSCLASMVIIVSGIYYINHHKPIDNSITIQGINHNGETITEIVK